MSCVFPSRFATCRPVPANGIKSNTVCFSLLRGKPLRSFKTVVQLIAATTTTTGLTVRAELDENEYPKGMKISDAQLAAIKLLRHAFHSDWNYTYHRNDMKRLLM